MLNGHWPHGLSTWNFTFKTLLRHYSKRALTPRSPNVKVGPRRNYHERRAAIRQLRHYANQPTRPLWPLRRRPNFTLRDRVVTARLAECLNSVLNVKVVVTAFNQRIFTRYCNALMWCESLLGNIKYLCRYITHLLSLLSSYNRNSFYILAFVLVN